MSQNIADNELCIKLVEAIQTNFNSIISNAGIELEKELEFDTICEILDGFLTKFNVIKDKKKSQYEKSKKRFSKVLNYNNDYLKENLTLCSELESHTDKFFESFNDAPNENWNLLHLVTVSYISYLKQTNDDRTLNYRGMIDKLMEKIEEYSAQNESGSDISDDSESDSGSGDNYDLDGTDPQQLLNSLKEQLPQTEKAPTVIKGLLGDIKGMLKSSDSMDSKSIVDISRDLSSKYQNMIESGDVNITDLLSGVIGLLNDPDAINCEFDDIDSSKLPDPSKILSEMSNDPSLKQAMGLLGGAAGKGGMPGGMDMSMLGSMMAGMMGSGMLGGEGKPSALNKDGTSAPKTINELEKEIERMMREVDEAEQTQNSQKDSSDNNQTSSA